MRLQSASPLMMNNVFSGKFVGFAVGSRNVVYVLTCDVELHV